MYCVVSFLHVSSVFIEIITGCVITFSCIQETFTIAINVFYVMHKSTVYGIYLKWISQRMRWYIVKKNRFEIYMQQEICEICLQHYLINRKYLVTSLEIIHWKSRSGQSWTWWQHIIKFHDILFSSPTIFRINSPTSCKWGQFKCI